MTASVTDQLLWVRLRSGGVEEGQPYHEGMAVLDDVRAWWDADAPGYDSVPHHHPTDPAVRAAWNAALPRHLPPVPSRILDCGAGTGFLSLTAARLGHRVVALDLSAAMLDRLSE